MENAPTTWLVDIGSSGDIAGLGNNQDIVKTIMAPPGPPLECVGKTIPIETMADTACVLPIEVNGHATSIRFEAADSDKELASIARDWSLAAGDESYFEAVRAALVEWARAHPDLWCEDIGEPATDAPPRKKTKTRA